MHIFFSLKKEVKERGHLKDMLINQGFFFFFKCDFSSHSRIFHSYMARSPLLVKGYKFWPILALIAIEQ